MLNNILRIYALRFKGQDHYWVLAGKVFLDQPNKKLVWLEDHTDIKSLLGDSLDDTFIRRINSMNANGRFKVVPESHLHVYHPEALPRHDLGDSAPDHKFKVIGPDINVIVEFHGPNAVINGKKVSEEELKPITDKLNSGEYHLEPLNAV
jgi:hypothetical protein